MYRQRFILATSYEGTFQRDLEAPSQATSRGATRPRASMSCADWCTPSCTRWLANAPNGGIPTGQWIYAPNLKGRAAGVDGRHHARAGDGISSCGTYSARSHRRSTRSARGTRQHPESIFIVVFEPLHDAVCFLTAERREIEQVVGVEQQVEAALVGRVRMEQAIAVPEEDAQPLPLAFARPAFGLGGDRRVVVHRMRLVERHPEVVIEVGPEGRQPRKRPTHALLEGFDLFEWRARDHGECGVARGEVHEAAREVVGDVGAGGAPFCTPIRTEHEVIGEELALPVEQIGERAASLQPLEQVLLLDCHHRQLASLGAQRVALAAELLLLYKQPLARGDPVVLRYHCRHFHCSLLLIHIGDVRPGTDAGAMRIRIPSATIASASGTSMAAFVGRSFWTSTRTAMTPIQRTLMTPSATSITISPILEPTQ